jgi:hypothetical protein
LLFFIHFQFFFQRCIYLESLLGLILYGGFFLIHGIYYHLTNGTTKNKKFNIRTWTFVEYEKWATILCIYPTHVCSICFHKYIPIFHFIKWNEIVFKKISCLGYIVKFFQKFEVGYTQTCTPFKSSTMWHHRSVLSPFTELFQTFKDVAFNVNAQCFIFI